MANFIKTVTNGLSVFGIDQTNKWGTILWGQNWGYGNNDLIVSIFKLISEPLTLTDTTSTQTDFIKSINANLTITGDMGSETISDPAGYLTVFQISTNAELRPQTSYTNSSAGSVTFTTVTATSTSWTEL